VIVEHVYRWEMADRYRALYRSASLRERERDARDYYPSRYPGAIVRSGPKIEDNEELNEIRDRTVMRSTDFWRKGNGSYREADLFPPEFADMIPDVPAPDRVRALVLPYPHHVRAFSSIRLPAGYAVEQGSGAIENRYFRFTYRVGRAGREVSVLASFETLQETVPALELKRVRTDLKAVYDRLGLPVPYLKPLGPSGSLRNVNWYVLAILAAVLTGSVVFLRRLGRRGPPIPLPVWLRPAAELEPEAPDLPGSEGSALEAVELEEAGPDHLEEPTPDGEPSASREWIPDQPLGGWLLLLGAGLVLRVVAQIGLELQALAQLSVSHWLLLSSPGSAAFHPGRLSIILFELCANAFVLVATVLLTFLFLRRRRSFPAYFWNLVLLTLAFAVLDVILGGSVGGRIGLMMGSIVGGTAAALAWLQYLARSKRARATFVT
jgi:hypothetical protein